MYTKCVGADMYSLSEADMYSVCVGAHMFSVCVGAHMYSVGYV